ncbi:hypothetical protein L9F63_023211, partial [Diploptera punctata]
HLKKILPLLLVMEIQIRNLEPTGTDDFDHVFDVFQTKITEVVLSLRILAIAHVIEFFYNVINFHNAY